MLNVLLPWAGVGERAGSKRLLAGRGRMASEVWVGLEVQRKSGHLRHSPLQAQHLLSLVLIMIHLSAMRQPLIPRL